MWRTRAVISMLVEDIAGLTLSSDREEDAEESAGRPELETLARAIRRARLVIAVDWIAILVLFIFRDPSRPFLPGGQSIETVFTLGVLVVAAHSGFRWAQLDRYRAVQRLSTELRDREDF